MRQISRRKAERKGKVSLGTNDSYLFNYSNRYFRPRLTVDEEAFTPFLNEKEFQVMFKEGIKTFTIDFITL